MDDNNVQQIKIVDKKDQLGDPGPTLTFIFTMLTMCFWGIYAGIFTGPTSLAVGLVQLACFAPYLIGAIFYLLKGDSLNGNAFLIFATLFGGVGGFSNIFLGLAEIFGWSMNGQMSAIPFIWGGISIFPVLIAIRKGASKMTFICYTAAAFFLIFIGLVSLNVLPAAPMNTVIMVLGFIVAITGFYEALNGLLAQGGCKTMPNGKPFFK